MQQTTPHTPLTSKDNTFIKNLRALVDPKHRKKERSFLIEGIKMVEEALRDAVGVKTVVAAPSLVQHHGKGILKLAEHQGIEVVWISDRLMDAVAESKTPQPVLAVLNMKEYTEDGLFTRPSGLIIVCHQLQDPGNLGTIIRTAEAVGASGMAITSNTVDPFNAKAVRASMGSILRMPVVQINSLPAFIVVCKRKGYQTVATTLTGAKTHYDADFTKPTVILLGQESAGLPQEIIADIDLSVRIPVSDTIDSLNVAVAAAVVLYEAMRQRLTNNFA
jgi:RNA methyltransferase, TrmH family